MDRFIGGGKESLSRDGRSTCSAQRENDNLKVIIAEYAIANEALKKRWSRAKDDGHDTVQKEDEPERIHEIVRV